MSENREGFLYGFLKWIDSMVMLEPRFATLTILGLMILLALCLVF